jgi:uncharacterized protein
MDRRLFLSFACAALTVPHAFAGGRDDGLGLFNQLRPDMALVAAARQQVGVTLSYDPAYAQIAYPLGDVPRDTGVCTDVVIRAYRDALGIDLQKRVHDDMARNFADYPKTWGLTKPDRNIDHRRVPNLMVFLKRAGAARGKSESAKDYLAGDLVTMMLPGNLPHIALVSDQRSGESERPLLIHNIGAGTREEDVLFTFPLTGHFRYELSVNVG